MTKQRYENITLIGMPASGKSTLGPLLATYLKLQFLDTDHLIQNKEHKRLSELIAEHGNEGFLKIEANHVANIEVEETVIATGGSIVYSDMAMQHLREISLVAWLDVDLPTLTDRIGCLDERGVVIKKGNTLADLLEERSVLYKKYAHVRVDCEAHTNDEILQMIAEARQG